MSDATDQEFRAVLEQHPSYRMNKDGSRIRCTGCRDILDAGTPPGPDTAFVKHVLRAFSDLSQELGSWRAKATALGPDLTGLTGLDLVVATVREGDLVVGQFHNLYLKDFTVEGVVVPSINAGQLVVGGHPLNDGARPAGGLRALDILAVKGEHDREVTPEILELTP